MHADAQTFDADAPEGLVGKDRANHCGKSGGCCGECSACTAVMHDRAALREKPLMVEGADNANALYPLLI